MAVAGEDSDGTSYNSVGEMWKKELGGSEGREKWYAKATDHWLEQEASVDGVLGGYSETNGPDLRESKRFITLLKKTPSPPGNGRALDCGAGIGRVTKGLLLDCFKEVDLVEPCAKLLDVARADLKGLPAGKFMNASLQDFDLDEALYDVIWAQWVLLYLTDDDLVRFLRRCQKGLREGGMICVKENVVLTGKWTIDRDDNSIMRTDKHYQEIFQRAGLKIVRDMRQTCWPTDLYPVKMYALQPDAALADTAAATEAAAEAGPSPNRKRGSVAAPMKDAAQQQPVRKRPASAQS
eukprot:TRINITY_DN63407_c0_g1_i1.p1 TRINITY_DN63407_c0_g1~~TRINITY_DN63407_c0_g1_i1.p1  ORF type:complete len:319 (+),score=63.18 TRINITY_DN63407_c0_g1_i1:77-958(+)